ncbi:MAG: type II secretion system protein N [Myxococcales bacterium]|jgi:general secretion pathway protein C
MPSLRWCFWFGNLAFLALAAWLAAKTANTLVLDGLLTLALPSSPPPPPPIAQVPPRTRLNPEAAFKLLGLEPTAGDAEPAAPSLDSEPVVSSLQVRLVGTMVANLSQWSLASIEDLVSKQTRVLMLGDQIQGATIVGINRLCVVIDNNGRLERIQAQPASSGLGSAGSVASASAARAGPGGPDDGFGSGIRALADGAYAVPKDEVARILANLDRSPSKYASYLPSSTASLPGSSSSPSARIPSTRAWASTTATW